MLLYDICKKKKKKKKAKTQNTSDGYKTGQQTVKSVYHSQWNMIQSIQSAVWVS